MGKSLLLIALIINRPTPGNANTVSATMAPDGRGPPTKLEAQHSDDWDQCILECVSNYDSLLTKPFGTRRSHKILVEYL